MKTCRACGVEKPLDMFTVRKSVCKSCRAARPMAHHPLWEGEPGIFAPGGFGNIWIDN